jgi:hypothetical protein
VEEKDTHWEFLPQVLQDGNQAPSFRSSGFKLRNAVSEHHHHHHSWAGIMFNCKKCIIWKGEMDCQEVEDCGPLRRTCSCAEKKSTSWGAVLCGCQCNSRAVATTGAQPVVAAPSSGMTPEESECFGVFCVTYDLKETDDDQRSKTWKKMVRVLVSRVAGMIANNLLFKLASE